MARIRWPLLEAAGYDVIAADQKFIFYAFATVYILFGWFGMVYLWRRRGILTGCEFAGRQSIKVLMLGFSTNNPQTVLSRLKEKSITHIIIWQKYFTPWAKVNLSEKELRILQVFYSKYTKLLLSNNGYSMYELMGADKD